jgi:hypothetical protein
MPRYGTSAKVAKASAVVEAPLLFLAGIENLSACGRAAGRPLVTRRAGRRATAACEMVPAGGRILKP